MPPDFHRVEITRPSDAIPARYNTETILGEEVSNQARRFLMSSPSYDLEH